MITYYGRDCYPISTKDYSLEGESPDADIFKGKESPNSGELFKLTQDLSSKEISTLLGSKKKLKDDPFLYFNYENRLWTAGRYIGSYTFKGTRTEYRLTIRPRFGSTVLNWLLTQSLGIRVVPSLGKIEKQSDENIQTFILAYLWHYYLADANRYGLPRTKKSHRFKGNYVRERLDVRSSVVSFKTEREVVSSYHTKELDPNVLRLLKLTYDYLKKDNSVAALQTPEGAKDLIREIESAPRQRRRFTSHDFKQIRLRSVYQSYRKVLDLSWNILQNKVTQNLESEQENRVLSTFVDMAEVWENFLKEVLSKELTKDGWILFTEEIKLYPQSTTLGRKIIPDIVLIKDNKALVLDAKYKLMKARQIDLDRTDFFQIHTYMSYFIEQGYEVTGGLIYPYTDKDDLKSVRASNPNTFFESKNGEPSNSKTQIFVEGMVLDHADNEKPETFLEEQKKEFLEQIKSLIQKWSTNDRKGSDSN